MSRLEEARAANPKDFPRARPASGSHGTSVIFRLSAAGRQEGDTPPACRSAPEVSSPLKAPGMAAFLKGGGLINFYQEALTLTGTTRPLVVPRRAGDVASNLSRARI
ncbi:hypothetical protein KM043_003622 [Ampulex compressa]|nr:hypothetical protein KM043_003622 [Ampulex compressa]